MGDCLRAGIPSRYVTSQLGQLSLASLRGRLIENQLRLGKGRNVTSAGWQVTLCDPMWHVSSRSGVATLRTAIHSLLTCYYMYVMAVNAATNLQVRAACRRVWLHWMAVSVCESQGRCVVLLTAPDRYAHDTATGRTSLCLHLHR